MKTTDTQQVIHLPQNNWRKFLPFIRQSGENGYVNPQDLGDDYKFLEGLGIFSRSAVGELTQTGRSIFESLFIRCDNEELELIQNLLLSFPPTIAIQQYLWGVKNIKVDQVLTVLKATGYWFCDSIQPLTHFLDMLNYAGVISYGKKNRVIKILISPDTQDVPKNVFIDPTRPFSNILWIKKILGECSGSIYWLDKHFQKDAFDWLWAIANAEKIHEIRILSLDLGENNLGKDALNTYKRFKQEMQNKGISVDWSTIDSTLIRDAHDRWIFDDHGYVRNTPNVNAILSGQRSEISRSDNYELVFESFAKYWEKSNTVAT